ncbi:hypothetical protein ABZ413_33570 [Nocardia rhamnosiphila]|uniref:hypothetical protein n=1 Tax=Nocardia rhamnosiphila TaxID=426716 RepID=UPI0033F83C61
MTGDAEQLAAPAARRRNAFAALVRMMNSPLFRMERRQAMMSRRLEILTSTKRLPIVEYAPLDYMVRRQGFFASMGRMPTGGITAASPAFDNPQVLAAQQRLTRTLMGSSLSYTHSDAALARFHGIFVDVISGCLTGAAYWLPDDVDPFQPSKVSGLDDQLPADRARNLAGTTHLNDYRKAILHHSQRRSTEPPGRVVTARRHLTRGPNTRWTTRFLCCPAGLART